MIFTAKGLSRRVAARVLLALGVLLAVRVAVASAPRLRDAMLVQPTAALAAQWCGGRLDRTAGEARIVAAGLPVVRVTDACSGAGFLALVTAGLAYRLGARRLPLALAVALLVVIPANAVRIVLAALAARVYGVLLPHGFADAVHYAVGLFVYALVWAALHLAFAGWPPAPTIARAEVRS